MHTGWVEVVVLLREKGTRKFGGLLWKGVKTYEKIRPIYTWTLLASSEKIADERSGGFTCEVPISHFKDLKAVKREELPLFIGMKITTPEYSKELSNG